MRSVRKKDRASAAKPSDAFSKYGKANPKSESDTGVAVSFASYDDLFSPNRANDDAVNWDEYEKGSQRSSGGTDSLPSTGRKNGSTVSSKGGRKNGSSTTKKKGKLFGRKSKKPAEDEDDELDIPSSAGSMSGRSESSFEEVFGRRVFGSGYSGADDDDFEFSNPTSWTDNAATKEAVYEVLAKSGSTQDKARQLFLLEALNRPAPPSEAPDYWSRPSAFSGARDKRKTRRVATGFYNIPSSGDVTPELFWSVSEMLSQGSSKLPLGWPVRADFLLDAVKHLGKLHQGGYVHGTFRSDNVLLDDNLSVYLRNVKTIRTLTKKEIKSGDVRAPLQQLDMMGFGLVILELAMFKPLSVLKAPKLLAAIKAEEKGKIDKLEEMADAVDAEVRQLLSTADGVPGSLTELCAQCLSPLRFNRPVAADAVDWLSDLRSDLQDPDTPSRSVLARDALALGKKMPLRSAKMFDTASVPDLGDGGYESDDSFQPPEGAEEAGVTFESSKKSGAPPPLPPKSKKKGGNKLQSFLSASANDPHKHAGSSGSVAGGRSGGRPKSMALPSGLNTAGLGGGSGSNSRGRSSLSDRPAKQKPRRRSLDRGYYYARSLMIANMEEAAHANKELISKANIQKFKQAFTQKGTYSNKATDPEELGARLDQQTVLDQEEALAIIKRADRVLRSEPNLVQLDTAELGNVTIVGDIHGQYYDLRNLIRIGGKLGKGKGKTTYLFLGDYIDRGDWGAEVLLYLFSLKVKYPEYIWLLRGNHEARTVSAFFGFKEECEKKYGLTVYNRCAEAFQAMPIAATVQTPGGKFLCVHGGISPNVQTLDQFIEFDRFEEPAMAGFLCDVLWSDPVKDSHEGGEEQSLADFLGIDFLPNPQRGCSYRYGFRALVSFLAVNGLCGLIRAHEVQEEGYLFHFQDLQGGAKEDTAAQVMPQVITVFSAPNYCGRYGNKGALIRIHHKPPSKGRKIKLKKNVGIRPIQLLEPLQFTAVAHPEPLLLENEQMKQTVKIETTCPYMPTTFNSFLKRAIEQGEEEAKKTMVTVTSRPDGASKNKHASIDRKDKRMSMVGRLNVGDLASMPKKAPPPAPARKKAAEPQAEPPAAVSTEEELSKRSKQQKNKNWKAMQLMGFDEATGAAEPAPAGKGGKKGKKPKAPKKKKKENKKYTEAAASDGINEMNPTMIADKMKEAESKLNPDNLSLPNKVRVQTGGNRKSLIKNNERSKLKKQPSLENIATKAKDGDAITFSSNELVCLQMLYLLIDHRDNGFISAEDLMEWSAQEGFAVRKSEAQLAISCLDVDQDSRIGFEDYLVFAARNKEKWLITQYDSVMKQIEQGPATPSRS